MALGVFGLRLGESFDPLLCASLTLIPVVQRAILEVALGFVCADREGRTGHGQGVAVQQRCVVVYGAQYPAEQVVDHGHEPDHQEGHADPPEVKRGQKQHVEVLVALVGRVIVAEVRLPSDRLWAFAQRSCCKNVHPGHVA